MTVKQLIRKLQHPPCERIAALRIEFADGGGSVVRACWFE